MNLEQIVKLLGGASDDSHYSIVEPSTPQPHLQSCPPYTRMGEPLRLDWYRPYWINDVSGELVCKFCNGRGDGSMLIPHHYDFCQRFPSWDLEECVRSMVRAVIVYILHVSEVERCDSV